MVHRVLLRVGSADALDFWADRLGKEGISVSRADGSLTFTDPEGLGLELAVVYDRRRAADRRAPGDPGRTSFPGLRPRARVHARRRGEPKFLEASLGFRRAARPGSRRAASSAAAPTSTTSRTRPECRAREPSITSPGARLPKSTRRGASGDRRRLPADAVIDRFYFKSIYFREPSGVLFEIATIGPGFTADEPVESLGEHLSLPPDFEHLREQVEPKLTPITNPRESWAAR